MFKKYEDHTKKGVNTRIKIILVVFLVGAAISQVYAQYEMKSYSINNGGSKMTGGSYVMNSSIGQADASGKLIGGTYSLNGGFWHEVENNDIIYKNGFE